MLPGRGRSPIATRGRFRPCSTGNVLERQIPDDEARGRLARGLAELGFPAEPDLTPPLLTLAGMLSAWSLRMNLTAHRSLDAIVTRMLLDAAALVSQLPALDSVADIGSGAGFPGLPLAILRPGCRVTLIEARRKRHHFQRAVVRELALSNVALEHGRAEDLAPRAHAGAIAQALAKPERALPWMLPWVEDGGYLLLPGSDSPPQVPDRTDVSQERLVRYRVPVSGIERSLWIGRRRPS
jgi:16S rRNA (guanine527-N7)-methyltransferase